MFNYDVSYLISHEQIYLLLNQTKILFIWLVEYPQKNKKNILFYIS